MLSSVEQFKDAVLVVCHPDDEILWFSSIIQHCKKVIVCFGREEENEKYSVDHLIQNVEYLDLQESLSFFGYTWQYPVVNEYGVVLNKKNLVYQENYGKLFGLLKERLQNETLVVTHNPWGEYGHEEHIQLSKIVVSLQESCGYELLFDSYVGGMSYQLMGKYNNCLEQASAFLETDRELAQRFKKHYIKHNMWTFTYEYTWPKLEFFLKAKSNGLVCSDDFQGATIPLNNIFGYSSHIFMLTVAVRKALPTFIFERLRLVYLYVLNFMHKNF